MKNVIVMLLTVMIIFAGCKKDNPMPTEDEIKKKREEIWKEIENATSTEDSLKTETTDTSKQINTIKEETKQETQQIANTAPDTKQGKQTITNENPPIIKEKSGIYKVQIFSATKKDYAEKIANELNKKLNISSAHIEKKRSFYRVIIGPFETRDEANKIRKECVKLGYKDAYILQSNTTTNTTVKKETTTDQTKVITQNLKNFYTIQIGSFSSLSNAEKYRKEANKKLNKETFIIKEGKLYKVFVGKYKNHKEAENNIKDVIKEYKDAFIIKK